MSDQDEGVKRRYATIRREAEIMAGGRADLGQRAAVYHHLFRHSGGNHVFPLIAAHGALWAKGYFALGMKIGWALSLFDVHRSDRRRERLAALVEFADAFRDLNRRVCIEVYATYHFTAEFGEASGAARYVDPGLLEMLNRCHLATRRGQVLPRAERRMLFERLFRWDQIAIVGPSVDAAISAFPWPLVRDLALSPAVRFAYIPRSHKLRFKNFADLDERIEIGLCAYEIAEDVGLGQAEKALSQYGVLPADLFKRAEALLHRSERRLLTDRDSTGLAKPAQMASLGHAS